MNQELNTVVSLLEKQENFRYERKFTIPKKHVLQELLQVVKRNPFLFSEIFHERRVNNIYFDTLNYQFYHDNVLGVSDRKKARIRWYGDTFGNIKKPILEIKLKKGVVGDKWSFPLPEFDLDNQITNKKLLEVFQEAELPEPIMELVRSLQPTLVNSYSRRYFLSADSKFRITLDYDILYNDIGTNFNNFYSNAKPDINNILELKYGLSDDDVANKIATHFPFRLDKNSKYVNGVDSFKNFAQ